MSHSLVVLCLALRFASALSEDDSTMDGTTAAFLNDTKPQSGNYAFYYSRVTDFVSLYGYGLVGILAVLGNALNIKIMGQQKDLSPYTYMTILAYCDLLTGLAMIWYAFSNCSFLQKKSESLARLSSHTAVPVYFLRDSFSLGATYLTTALSIDRLIAVKFPLKRSLWCTVRKARIVSLCLMVIGFAVNVHEPIRLQIIWIFDPTDGAFMPAMGITAAGRNHTLSVMVLYLTIVLKISLPLILMVISNAITLKEVGRSMKFREEKSSKSAAKGDSNQCLLITVGVITTFVMTSIPRAAYQFNLAINGYPKNLNKVMMYTAVFSELIMWSNSCSNFFIYIVLNAKFRQDVINLFGCQKKAKGEPLTSTSNV